MQTVLSESIKNTEQGQIADTILRKCVHCGFCNATCPTYQLLGDELDGPRGRIYQIKQVLEGVPANSEIQKHLDRCLSCRACETTCPSGVKFSSLLEIGRDIVDEQLPRPLRERFYRGAIRKSLSSQIVFANVLALARSIKKLLPRDLAQLIPEKINATTQPSNSYKRKMVTIAGCVQPTLTPKTNAATAAVLDRFGIELIEISGQCCGAVPLHTSDKEKAVLNAKSLIDAWWPYVEDDVEAFIVTASGCGLTVQEYPDLFENESEYYQKACKIRERMMDLSQVIENELKQSPEKIGMKQSRVAFHSPCTLQHGLGIKGQVERILERLGYDVCVVENAHECCGSAGTYSLLQSVLSSQLKTKKLKSLTESAPDIIATANVGCQSHFSTESKIKVVHWIELLL